MEDKFTKGEWVVDDAGDIIVKGSKGRVISPVREGTIASFNDGEYIENTNKHDAYLMVQSKNMYNFISSLQLSVVDKVKAEALLAKARGE